MAHPHAELMKQYAEDAAIHNEPWKLWEYKRNKGWITFKGPLTWDPAGAYRRKPDRVIVINGFDVPEPLRVAPPDGTAIYLADVFANQQQPSKWIGSDCQQVWLRRGLVHVTPEAAQQHIDAVLSFTSTE